MNDESLVLRSYWHREGLDNKYLSIEKQCAIRATNTCVSIAAMHRKKLMCTFASKIARTNY